MRTIAAGPFRSLDGVVEAPDRRHGLYFNDEMGATVTAAVGTDDPLLLGRKTDDTLAEAFHQGRAAR